MLVKGLAGRVTDIAAALGIRQTPGGVLPVHHRSRELPTGPRRRRARGGAGTPTILDLASVGRLVASLGQAVRCVSLNHGALAGSTRDKWEAVGVLDAASNGLTLLGAALEYPDATAGRVSVLISDGPWSTPATP